MGKGKKKKKKAPKVTLLDIFRPFITDNRVLFGILDAAAAGVALVSSIKAWRTSNATEAVAQTTKEMVEDHQEEAGPKKESKKQLKGA